MKRPSRLPYCGTCKTMGVRYGQTTRLLLNHDTVFLAELLLEFGGEREWSPAYRSFNCASMPNSEDVPVALDFAAAATIVLTHFRVEDHRVDSRKPFWAWALRLLSPSYRRAAERLRSWQFPLDELAQVLATQGVREAQPESLAHVAEPTAVATSLFFDHGTRLIGREDLRSTMGRIGHRFGFLIYALDSFEDRARDEKCGDFNPLLQLPGVDARAEILAALSDLERDLPPGFSLRLRANVEERLGMRPRVLAHRCKRTLRDRWADAVALARALRKNEGALTFAAGCLAAFLVPHYMRTAESLKHGLGLGMNLMAAGVVLSSAMPPPPPPPGYGSGPGQYRPEVAIPPGSGRIGGGSNCNCGGCGNCCNCCGSCECCAAECCAESVCEACCSIGSCCN